MAVRAQHAAVLLAVVLYLAKTAAGASQQQRRAVIEGLPEDIPLTLLLGNPKYRNPQMDNFGRYLTFIKPDSNDILNIFVQQIPSSTHLAGMNRSVSLVDQQKGSERQLTFDKKRGVLMYSWGEDDSTIFYLQDMDGDENYQLFMVPISSLFQGGSSSSAAPTAINLTPYKGVKVQDMITSNRFPRKIYFTMNKRSRMLYDLYSVDLDTREVHLDTVNSADGMSWLMDYDFQFRGFESVDSTDGSSSFRINDAKLKPSSISRNPAVQEEKGGSKANPKAMPILELFKAAEQGNWTLDQWIAASSSGSDMRKWRVLLAWPFQEAVRVLRFNKAGDGLYGTTSIGRNTMEFVLWSTAPGAQVMQRFAGSNISNTGSIVFSELTWQPRMVSFDYLRPRWEILDPSLKDTWERVQAFLPNRDPAVVGVTLDGKTLMISYNADNTTTAVYLYKSGSWPPQLLLEIQPGLKKHRLSNMHPVVITAADGLKLPSYLSLPVKPNVPAVLPACLVGPVPDKKPAAVQAMNKSPVKCPLKLNLPMVLYVHGGPWSRDTWGIDTVVQLLTNRGYAVLQVNFRGSTGYGKEFLNKGNLQWGVGTMQSDLTDAVKWAVQQGVADPAKVCIHGGSYGGYATLAGLAFTPELYACGVDLVGISNVGTFFKSIPPYWKPMRIDFVKRIGDAEANSTWNEQISPVFHVRNIRAPLLIGQGANDPRVPKNESDQMFRAMKTKGLDIDYVVYPDEGHGLIRSDNRLDFYYRMEQFLSKHLGGRAADFKRPPGSSAQVITSV